MCGNREHVCGRFRSYFRISLMIHSESFTQVFVLSHSRLHNRLWEAWKNRKRLQEDLVCLKYKALEGADTLRFTWGCEEKHGVWHLLVSWSTWKRQRSWWPEGRTPPPPPEEIERDKRWKENPRFFCLIWRRAEILNMTQQIFAVFCSDFSYLETGNSNGAFQVPFEQQRHKVLLKEDTKWARTRTRVCRALSEYN